MSKITLTDLALAYQKHQLLEQKAQEELQREQDYKRAEEELASTLETALTERPPTENNHQNTAIFFLQEIAGASPEEAEEFYQHYARQIAEPGFLKTSYHTATKLGKTVAAYTLKAAAAVPIIALGPLIPSKFFLKEDHDSVDSSFCYFIHSCIELGGGAVIAGVTNYKILGSILAVDGALRAASMIGKLLFSKGVPTPTGSMLTEIPYAIGKGIAAKYSQTKQQLLEDKLEELNNQ